MKIKDACKHILDLCMSVMLLFLMAYQATGEKAHEWLGIGVFVLIAAHNILNIKWYRAVFSGRYTIIRAVRTAVNILLLLAMLGTMASGILMNRYVFPVEIHGTMAAARVLHLAGSYWSFVLMSVHLGLHRSMVMGFAGRRMKINRKGIKNVVAYIMRFIAAIIAVYGGYCFISADIFTYMTFQTHFAFLDYERQPVLVIYDQLAVMGFWIFLSYYFTRLMQYFSKLKIIKKQCEEDGREEDICIYFNNKFSVFFDCLYQFHAESVR